MIGNCRFADDVLYDTESNTWVRFEEDGAATVGINAVLAWLGGPIPRSRSNLSGRSWSEERASEP